MSHFPLLRDLLGEPRIPMESFARAVGPVERKLLAPKLGPQRLPKTLPPTPPPHHELPRSAPPRGGSTASRSIASRSID